MKQLDLTDYSMRDTADLIKNHVEGLLKGEDHMPCLEEQMRKLRQQMDKHVGKIFLLTPQQYDKALRLLGITHRDVVEQNIQWRDLVKHLDEQQLSEI